MRVTACSQAHTTPRIRSLANAVGDQKKEEDLARVVSACNGEFYDIIIDDGLHSAEAQQKSLKYLFRHLKPGGLYIIEDVHMLKARDVDPNKIASTCEVLQYWNRTGTLQNSEILANTGVADEIDFIQIPFATGACLNLKHGRPTSYDCLPTIAIKKRN